MPISEVTTGHGTELWINPSGVLTKVAEIDDFPELPTSAETEIYEVSHLGTTGYREHKKHPLKDGTPITFVGNYVINSASDTLLQAADDAEGPIPYKIVVLQGEDSFDITGSALFYGLKRKNPKGEKRTFEMTMKPTVKPTTAATAP